MDLLIFEISFFFQVPQPRMDMGNRNSDVRTGLNGRPMKAHKGRRGASNDYGKKDEARHLNILQLVKEA